MYNGMNNDKRALFSWAGLTTTTTTTTTTEYNINNDNTNANSIATTTTNNNNHTKHNKHHMKTCTTSAITPFCAP